PQARLPGVRVESLPGLPDGRPQGDEGYGYLTLDQPAARMNEFGDVVGLAPPGSALTFLRCEVSYKRVPSADPAGENPRLYAAPGQLVRGKAHLVAPPTAQAPFRLLLEAPDGAVSVVLLEATTRPVFQP